MFSFFQDFQKDIVRAIEALAIVNSKHVEVGKYFLQIVLDDFYNNLPGNSLMLFWIP